MADDRHEQSVDIVARRILCNAARLALDDRARLGVDYGVNPETLDAIESRVGQIIGSMDPHPDEFTAGWGYLRRVTAELER